MVPTGKKSSAVKNDTGRRRGRPPKGARGDTRQDLLDAALKLFATQGYTATTVRQIADQVGVRDSAIYAHFAAKQEMLDALIADSAHAGDERVMDLLADADAQSPEAVLESAVGFLITAWEEPRQRQLISCLMREGLAARMEFVDELRNRLLALLKSWQKAGRISNQFDPRTLLWELTAPLGAIRMGYFNAESSAADRREGGRLANAHLEFFLSGIR